MNNVKKICTFCKESKPISEYNKNKSRKDGHSNFCRVCNNKRNRDYYNANKTAQYHSVKKRNKRIRAENQEKMCEILDNSSCLDCGESNMLCLEFDHMSDKYKNMSTLLTGAYCWETIEKEMKKCDIVCRNCHTKRTHETQQTYRWKHYLNNNTSKQN